jgi:AcrR family transcriptional regulator
VSAERREDPEHPAELARLPHGRHGLPPEFVRRNQRERLIASFISLLGEGGYGAATIATITAGAGVSSRTFYKYFETVEDCYLAAFDKAIEDLRDPVGRAFRAESDWVAAVRSALTVLLEEFAGFSDLARLLTAEPFVAGHAIAQRHKQVIEQISPFMRGGRDLDGAAADLPDSTEKGLLGGANSMIGRLAFGGGSPEQFRALAPDLLQFLLTPYLGPAAARRAATGA